MPASSCVPVCHLFAAEHKPAVFGATLSPKYYIAIQRVQGTLLSPEVQTWFHTGRDQPTTAFNFIQNNFVLL